MAHPILDRATSLASIATVALACGAGCAGASAIGTPATDTEAAAAPATEVELDGPWWTGADACPPGSRLVGSPPPRGRVVRCQKSDGTMHGRWVVWYANGRKAEQGLYVEGELLGLWTGWYEDGTRAREGAFQAGVPFGTWTGWHANGQRKWEGDLVEGFAVGLWSFWDGAGELTRTEEYDGGHLVSTVAVGGEPAAPEEPAPPPNPLIVDGMCVPTPDAPATEPIRWSVAVGEDTAFVPEVRAKAEAAGCEVVHGDEKTLTATCDGAAFEADQDKGELVFHVTGLNEADCRALMQRLLEGQPEPEQAD